MSPVKFEHSLIAKRVASRPNLRSSLGKVTLSASRSLLPINRGRAHAESRTSRRLPEKSERNIKRRELGAIVAAFLLGALVLPAIGRDNGNWETIPQNVRDWFAKLMQPDNPKVSCCGEADAYWADRYRIDGNQYVAIITDDRSTIYDEYIGRITRSVGTEILVPNRKVKWDAGNPTGHGIVFLSTGGSVICYLPPGGV